MEDKKASLISISIILSFIIIIIICRISLKLSKPFFLILGADLSLILAVLAYIVIRYRFNQRRRLLETQLVSEGRELRIEYSFLRKVAGVPSKFKYKDIEEATDKFSSLLGQGSSGCVFKGILSDGTSVAVKRIESEEKGEKEFRSEVAAIASVQHVNLVRLYGYCVNSNGPRFLVYEYIPNGSLDSWIFPKRVSQNRPNGCLSWELRYRVAIDVAKALSYLHHDCRSRILHLDVKPENILLDGSYRGIVGDFGLSKLMRKDQSRVITTIRGTRGYLAPEWLLEHGVSEKSDIYSYGMVLFEMIGGRRNVSMIENGTRRKWQYFPKIVREKLREGKIMEVVDNRLIQGGSVDEREVKKLVNVAFWCIQERARVRPSMAKVVEMLEGSEPVAEPPETQMIIVDLLAIDEDEDVGRSGLQVNRPRRYGAMAANLADANVVTTSNYSSSVSVLSGR